MKKIIIFFALLSFGANAAVYNLSGKVIETTREIIQLDGRYVYRDSMSPVFSDSFCDIVAPMKATEYHFIEYAPVFKPECQRCRNNR